ncbi:hypothetical protein MPH_13802 [Macrophomina phaseolina MS6]|uniref:Rhodopsin domain-containing protein n=1 Tax=Macrophomina phaseolina (strain MS6) TaxID=1126212 RepID=K2R8H7_MACPH|nr:hypothetical protein MPH_13802 [Macrophomina phaseolina MS6]
MSAKLSILSFYLRFSPAKRFKMTVYVLITVVIIYSLLGSFFWLYACQPMARMWDRTITSGSCIDGYAFGIFYATTNSVTDLTILFLPVFQFWNVQLPRRQRIGVSAIFMTGGLAMELYVGIISVCLPHAKPFLQYHFPKTPGSSFHSSPAATRSTGRSTRDRSRTLQSHNGQKDKVTERIERCDDEIPLEPMVKVVGDSIDEVSQREESTSSLRTPHQVV